MARGFKTGGRQKGSKNKRTLLQEERTRALVDNAREITGGELFEGDAHTFLILTYQDKSLPRNVRLDAAKAAIRFEKPAMTAIDAHNTIEKVHYAISDEPMSHEEWVAQYCKPPSE
jgi:hypothetical protein